MASGVGSASMNAASLGPTLAAFPGLETQIEAFAGFSNLLSFSAEYISSCFWLCHSLKNYIQF